MAVVQVNENTLDFIFDESVNNYEIYNNENFEIFCLLSSNAKIYYYDENNNLVEIQKTISGDGMLIFYTASAEEVGVQISFAVIDNSDDYIAFSKLSKDVPVNDSITALKNIWYYAELVNDQPVLNVIKGFRIENFAYADGQTLETINTLVNPYIGTKTSFAKTYTLRVNGKLLNTINGKKIRNLIYNGTTYEIAEPTSSGYTLTMNIVSGNNFYLSDVAYTTNGGVEYTNLSSSQAGTAITLNNVVSITFKDTYYTDFIPDIDSGVKIGSTSGGTEYGSIKLKSGETITIDLTQDTTIYVEGAIISRPPDIPML